MKMKNFRESPGATEHEASASLFPLTLVGIESGESKRERERGMRKSSQEKVELLKADIHCRLII